MVWLGTKDAYLPNPIRVHIATKALYIVVEDIFLDFGVLSCLRESI